jgi:uncharacterized protein YjbI with pentapeptide repeats
MADEQRDATQSVSNGQYNAQAANGSTATVNVTNIYSAPQNQTPFLNPHPHDNYVARPEEENKLIAALSQSSYKHPIVLYGMSGIGKTWLAAKVVHTLHEKAEQKRFPGGILWGSLDDFEPPNLLAYFLRQLGNETVQNGLSPQELRTAFWGRLKGDKLTLIVFDDVKDERQVSLLLPAPSDYPANCCVLLISVNSLKLPYDDSETLRISLGTLHKDQSINVFQKYLRNGKQQIPAYNEKQLAEIARLLGYIPLLLATAARNIKSGTISPSAYIVALRDRDSRTDAIGKVLWEGLALALQNLSPTQRDFFDFIGALGEGSWQLDMLASVALRRPSEIDHDLAALVERELVKPTANGRYDVNTIIYEYARHRFQQLPDYVQRAALINLAYYCITLAQNIRAELEQRPNLRSVQKRNTLYAEESFVQAFAEEIEPEMSHIRHVLDWAEQRQDWDLLQRFSYVAHTELLKYFVASNSEIHVALCMATVVEPIVGGQRAYLEPKYQTLINPTGWKKSGESENKVCELDLDIQVGHVIDGLFEDMRLFDTRWIGVRATGCIFRNVEMIGCQFIACDLSQSVWTSNERSNAQQIVLSGSNLNYALLHNVRLPRASMHRAKLNGTVLQGVDLRGADLREADFSGATLEDTDLRGAYLYNANFTQAILRNVQLTGCRIEGICWHGATLDSVKVNSDYKQELEQQAQEQVSSTVVLHQPRERPIEGLLSLTQGSDHGRVDDGQRRDFASTDLRAAAKNDLKLQGCRFSNADMRAVNLESADFTNVDLSGADLRAARLHNAKFKNANLRNADLRAAILTKACLDKANLHQALLRAAILSGGQLSDATLTDSNLVSANLNKAHLTGVKLKNADLTGVDLTDANLTDADLTDVICEGANFTNAIVTEEQLAKATFRGGAKWRTGDKIQVLRGEYKQTTKKWVGEFLLLAHLNAEFEQEDMSHCELLGAQLGGIFKGVSLKGAKLDHADLSGRFLSTNFTGASLNKAQLLGIFKPKPSKPPTQPQTVFDDATLEDALLDGLFYQVRFQRAILRHARLPVTGKFSSVDFSTASLPGAHLSGTFTKTTFNQAFLIDTVMQGTFVKCSFVGANFQGADICGVSFVNCDLTDANIEKSQLRQAARLRGCIMPNGSPYDGSFDLPGDRKDAQR